MRSDILICAALVWPFLLAGQTNSGSVSGRIINSATAAPVSRASVILHLNTADNLAATAATDSNGLFSFQDLPAGTYTLEARHTGFDTTWFGACSGEQQGTPIEIKAGERRDRITIGLSPLAVITGTVTGPEGEPVSGALVMVRPVFVPPDTRISKRLDTKPALTGAQGQFRLFGIRAGEYFVSAASGRTVFSNLTATGQPGVANARYGAVYYAGTPARASATKITLSPGELRGGIDFQLPLVYSAKLEVNVQAPPDFPELSYDANLESAFEGSLVGYGFETPGTTKTPLHFEDVSPGKYYLQIFASKNGHFFGSYDPINVSNDGALQKATVALSSPVELHGTIQIDSAPANPRCCRIALKSANSSAYHGEQSLSAALTPGGAFIISNVLPGRWSIDVQSIPDGAYVKSIRFAGKDVSHDDLTIDSHTREQLEISIGARSAEISGSVTNAKGGKVLLAPTRDPEKPYLYRTQEIEPDGTFHIRGITPGEYHLLAFRNLEDEAWLDPDFRARIKGKGVGVLLRDGTTFHATLSLSDPATASCMEPNR